MKNTQTLGLLLGTTCLATIAMTQVTRPGDAPNQERQQPPVAGQQNADSLKMVQQRFQQAVTSEVRAGAMKHDVKIDESSVMISLIGDGMVAGAPASNSTGSGVDAQKKPGEPTSTTGSATGTARDQSQPGTTTTAAANQNVIGIVLLSRNLAPNGAAGQSGAAGRTPGAAGSQNSADGAQEPQNGGREAAGQGTTNQTAAGSNELMAFEVRRSQQGNNVELVDQNGQVALQVQLLGAANAAGRTREASAPREDREDATVGGGDPLADPRSQDPKAKDPQGKDKARTVAPTPSDMNADHAGSADWSVVYASVVNQLCSKHHGKK